MNDSIWRALASIIVTFLVLGILVAGGHLVFGILPLKVEDWNGSLNKPAIQFRVGVILSLVGFVISLGVGQLAVCGLRRFFYGDDKDDSESSKLGILGFTSRKVDKEAEKYSELQKLIMLQKLPEDKRKPFELQKPPEDERKTRITSSAMIGLIERSFFTVAVAVHPGISIAGMFGWIAAKMLTSANRAGTPATQVQRSSAFATLAMGLCAMFFALLGGLLLYFGTRLIGMSLGLFGTGSG